MGSRRAFLLLRNRILKVEDQRIGCGGRGLGEAIRA